MQSQREHSIRQKLGSILGLGQPRGVQSPQRSHEDHVSKSERSTFITDDVLRELNQNVPTQQRVRAMKELHDLVATKRLEEHAVETIWLAVRDLLEPSQPIEVRHTCLAFLKALIYGQFEDLGILRSHFFRLVQQHTVEEDVQQMLEIFRVLTQDGKNIQHLEDDIGPFLLHWMPEVTKLAKPVDFLSLLINFIHYNATYLDEEVLVGLVQLTCSLANKSTQPNVITLCLDLLNAVVCYSSLPADSLKIFVITLCQCLNIECFSKKSLDVILRLLGTHLGRSAIYTMCTLLQERSQDALLLRGAVFYISMSLWGVRKVKHLDLTFASVLPSIKQAVLSGHTIVVYEVALSLSRLVRTHPEELHPLEWDAIYDIMNCIQDHMTKIQAASGHAHLLPSNNLEQCMRELFSTIEQLYEDGNNIGTSERFFNLVEANIASMPLHSVLTLVTYRSRMIDSCEEGWVDHLIAFIDKFCKREKRTAVRLDALNYLGSIVAENSLTHESELMERVVLPTLGTLTSDPDVDVRRHGAQKLVEFLSTVDAKWGTELLAIGSSILQQGLYLVTRTRPEERVNKSGEAPQLPDSKALVLGLIKVFREKLYCSSPVAAQVLSQLVALLHQHYDEGCFLPATCNMRVNIFNCILNLRSNDLGQVGYLEKDRLLKFSPFFVCFSSDSFSLATMPSHSSSSSTAAAAAGGVSKSLFSPTLLDLHSTFTAILACLEKECEREVLVPVLQNLEGLLQDRTLTLSAMTDLSSLCQFLCRLTSRPPPATGSTPSASPAPSGSTPSSLQQHLQQPLKLRQPVLGSGFGDVSSFVYPVLATLASYPTHLDRKAQHSLVCALEAGLVGRSSQMCVSSLTLCALELQATMTRLLPSVLFRLSQIAATLAMALPVLEFLSSLIPIPSLYSTFVEREYLSIVAIALPYTNHEKYSPYVIAMAHRVIAQWFVVCRVHCRPAVAKYINKTLTTDLNVTSRRPIGSQTTPESRANIGLELMEVCQDMMARYTYSNLSTLPSRSLGAELLVAGGPTKTWIVANSLVTITTSGQGGGRSGSCARCASNRKTTTSPSAVEDPLYLHGNSSPPQLCSCWCRGWAEITIRRPTGNISWLMRVQNRLQPLHPVATAQLGQGLDSQLGLVALNLPNTATEIDKYNVDMGAESAKDACAELAKGVIAKSTKHLSIEQESAKVPSPTVVEATKKEKERENCDWISIEMVGTGAITNSTDSGREEAWFIAKELTNTSETTDQPPLPRDEAMLSKDSSNQQEGDDSEVTKHSLVGAEQHRESSPCKAIGSSTSSPSRHHQHTSVSWSGDDGGISSFPLSPKPSSYSTHFPLEHLPPLLSYDEAGEGWGRSPRLHGNSVVLSEEEQLTLHASMSDIATSHSDQSDDESDTPTGSPIEEPDMKAFSSSEGEGDDITINLRENPTPLPHPSPQHVKPQQPLRPSSQNTVPPQTLIEGASPTPPMRKLSIPFYTGSGAATPIDSPSIARRPLIYTQHTQGGVSDPIQNGIGTGGEDSELYNDPSFIFLQLYGCCVLADPEDRPLLLQNNDVTERAMKVLDLIPPYDTHKLGVVYVGRGQQSESEILANTFGSSRYIEFLRGLGPLLRLQDVPQDMVYLGGLDCSGTDGQFTYCYHDDITQVVFHVATLMPTDLTSDPQCSNKKLHIGNNYVLIVYNDSGSKYNFGTIKGQFNFAEVLVEPLAGGLSRVSVRAKRGMEQMLDSRPFVISDQWLPVLVRLKALQANLASLVHVCETTSAGPTERYLTNWLGRLRQINRIREKQSQDLIAKQGSPIIDFTYYS